MNNNLPEPQLIHEIAKVLPKKAWVRIVNTACNTFEDCIAPLTQTTSGIGRLIKARFDRLADIEKVLAAHALQEARRNLVAHSIPVKEIKNPKTFLESLAGSSSETSVDLHGLWVNLLAQEMATGTIHPEIPRVLERLTPDDARLLAKIHKNCQSVWNILSLSRGRTKDQSFTAGFLFHRQPSLNHGVLESLNLVRNDEGSWQITVLGRAFIAAVSDPWEKKQESEQPGTPHSEPTVRSP